MLFEFPDLSNHVDTAAAFAGGVPVAKGSAPSTHIIMLEGTGERETVLELPNTPTK